MENLTQGSHLLLSHSFLSFAAPAGAGTKTPGCGGDGNPCLVFDLGVRKVGSLHEMDVVWADLFGSCKLFLYMTN